MTRLSVNINKIATLRNARGGNIPDVFASAEACLRFGADGITVHPRPDERHIRFSDVIEISKFFVINRRQKNEGSPNKPEGFAEFNIEGFPDRRWMDLVIKVKPDQATLVPDSPEDLTSGAGWDTVKNQTFLAEIISELKRNNIRASLFTGTETKVIEGAAKCGAARVELFTGPYALHFKENPEKSISPFIEASKTALKMGLELNAGHDLNLENLNFFRSKVSSLREVSIGHSLISDALYFGLENTIQMYLRELNK